MATYPEDGAMSEKGSPPPAVMLELASLAREQMGPFLILGVDKTADKEQIEKAWAQRLIWARKGQIKVPLEDINWAREVLSDNDRRARADAASLNLDTAAEILRHLRSRRDASSATAGCWPRDDEISFADYAPDIPVPGDEEIRALIPVGEVPYQAPFALELLMTYVQQPLTPWDNNLLPSS
jgi:hypothetical protein